MQSGYLKLGRAPSDAERTHTGLAIQGTETQVHGVAKITHSYLRLEWCLPRRIPCRAPQTSLLRPYVGKKRVELILKIELRFPQANVQLTFV